jgi:hypothetical protein
LRKPFYGSNDHAKQDEKTKASISGRRSRHNKGENTGLPYQAKVYW